METFLINHIYHYLPFGLSFIALYLKVLDIVYAFEWRRIGDIVSRFLYVLFFGYATYNIESDGWFGIIAVGTLILFTDETISYIFNKKRKAKLVKECIRKVLKGLEEVNWGA